MRGFKYVLECDTLENGLTFSVVQHCCLDSGLNEEAPVCNAAVALHTPRIDSFHTSIHL